MYVTSHVSCLMSHLTLLVYLLCLPCYFQVGGECNRCQFLEG
jgi:hypothetical protein